jgi:hypothetical protein
MRAYFKFVLRYRIAVIIACLGVTAAAGLGMRGMVLSSSLPELVFGDDPAYHRYIERVSQFGTDEQLVVATPLTHSGDPVAQFRDAASCLEQRPDVWRVTGPHHIPGRRDDSTLGSLATAATRIGLDGLVISADGKHGAMTVEMQFDARRPMEKTPQLVSALLDCFVDAGFERQELHLGGQLAIMAQIQKEGQRNLRVLLPAVAIVILLATYLLFRRLWPVVLTGTIGTIAIIWTLGGVIALDREINIMVMLSPALILLIAFSDVVHLCTAYVNELRRGRGVRSAIMRSASHVGPACLITSLTTFVGFAGLTLMSVPAFRKLGAVLGAGVAIALLLAMTGVPVFLSLIRTPRRIQDSHSRGNLALTRLLGAMERCATRRPWSVIAVFAVFGAASIWGISRIEIETDLIGRMHPDSPLRQDAEYMNRNFAGVSILELFVQPGESARGLGPLSAYHDMLSEDPDVGKVVSAAMVRGALPVESLAEIGRLSTHGLSALYDASSATWRVILFLKDSGMYKCFQVGERARSAARTVWGDDVEVEASGLQYLAGRWLENHLIAQGRAMWLSFATIAVILMCLFRSLIVGLWSMVPNLFPLIALGGVLGWWGAKVDSDLVIVVLVAIGIAVDDTIHFLVWYLRTRRSGHSRAHALHRAFDEGGRAIIITSFIFMAGFAPFALSDYTPIRAIGILMPLVMGMALLSDVLLLPALLSAGLIPVRGESPLEPQADV